MRRVVLLLAVSGCNDIYGIEKTAPEPPVDLDRDDDGLNDIADNCPADPNLDQRDTDRDGVGDVCDSCPITGNATQADLDGDAVGDVCDPHVGVGGDCLVLFDSFTGGLAADWEIVKTGAATAETGPDGLRLAADASSRIRVLSRAVSGELDVEIYARVTNETPASTLGVVIAADDAGDGLHCRVYPAADNKPGMELFSPLTVATSPLLTPAIEPDVRIRMIANDRRLPRRHALCRVDFGIAAGILSDADSATSGRFGLDVRGGVLQVAGIAAYSFDPGRMTCPPRSVR